MTSEGARNGNGHEHAGGYESPLKAPPLGETLFAIAYGMLGFAANLLLDAFAPGEPAKYLFFLIMCALLLALMAREIFRAGRLDPEEQVANPMSVLYPERIEDDAGDRQRRRRARAVFLAIVSLAGLVYCLRILLETGIPVANLPAVMLIVAAFFIVALLLGAYHRRRRRQSSPE